MKKNNSYRIVPAISDLKYMTLAACIILLSQCGYHKTIIPLHEHKLVEIEPKDSLEIILLGDTGLKNASMDAVMESIRKEASKDYVAVLGDLIYPRGPKCKEGAIKGEAKALLDERIGDPFGSLDVPVFLAVGNHDVSAGLLHKQRHSAREACFLDYAALHDNIIMPSLTYTVDLGAATIAVINSNKYNLNAETADIVKSAFDQEDRWRILIGHHGLKIYYNKEKETAISNWMKEYDVNYDLIGNGHAHIQQFGVYDGIMAVTSGATAKVRERPTCDLSSEEFKGNCMPGMQWGKSNYGYVVLKIVDKKMTVIFKDINGQELYKCESLKGSGVCETIPSINS